MPIHQIPCESMLGVMAPLQNYQFGDLIRYGTWEYQQTRIENMSGSLVKAFYHHHESGINHQAEVWFGNGGPLFWCS